MPFDPNKPFKVIEPSVPHGFDSSKPYRVLTEEQASKPLPTMAEAATLGGFQGLSLNTADELSGLIEGVGSVFGRRGWGTEPIFQGRPETPQEKEQTFSDVYQAARDIRREKEKAAKAQYPYVYGGSEFIGSMAVPIGAGAAAKTMLGAAAKGAGAGLISGGLSGMGATEEESIPAILGEGAKSAVLGGIGGAVAGPIGRLASGVTKAGRESLKAEAEAFKRGFKSNPEDAILEGLTGRSIRGFKETLVTTGEMERFKRFLGDNKSAFVSQMVEDGQIPVERTRAARSMLDQMSDDEYIQMMVRSEGYAADQIKNWISKQSAAGFGGRMTPEEYAKVLGMSMDQRSAARSFQARKEAEGIVEPAQKALSTVTKTTKEKFRELEEQASEEFEGFLPEIQDLSLNSMKLQKDIKKYPAYFTKDFAKTLKHANLLLDRGEGPEVLNLKPGKYAKVDNIERFNRLQKFKETLRSSIRPDVLQRKVGASANLSERSALDLISKADDLLRSSDAKIKANAIYKKMKDIEDFVFKNITRRGEVIKGKVESQLSDSKAANQWREDLNDLRSWADDPIFDAKDREEVGKFVSLYDEAFKKAEDQRTINKFNYKEGPTSAAVQRLGSILNKNTEIMDLLQNPAKATAEIDSFANSYLKQLTGKSKFGDLTPEEQRAFVRTQTWFKNEVGKGLVSPQSLVDNYGFFLKKLQKEASQVKK